MVSRIVNAVQHAWRWRRWTVARRRVAALGVLFYAALVLPGAAGTAADDTARCVQGSPPDVLVTLAGRLTLQTFAGPPNYESIERGDSEEKVFILKLPRRICFEDGEFADGSERFDRVQVHAMEPELIRTLRQAVRREVTVAGRAVGAHTGHHHAPMVLFAGAVKVRGAAQ